ncbi:hypothetical protein F2P81_007365 [Scophthalmus maximus]|uniref:Uncharacterized protein n=1 Tax=Scophthalmus maximus TaxID=52904 RepID=A0A6A4T5E2_SCOMX|nr:hypothetical protein F2P81_007365 [Scophthalmus maximus]
MVLEDVDSDNEGHCNAAVPSTKLDPPSPATTTTPQQQEATRRTQTSWQPPAASTLSQVCGDVGPVAALSDGVEKMSQEDAETQTGRWTPFIESIKREAEDVALATMEERLLYERMEMARMAEEVARQTAEMAIRQMASEGQSIKLSLGSAELLEEPEAGQEESLSEEEQREDTELSNLTEAAPVSCDAFESCLMRIPHTSECLGNINAFFKENGISPPKIPPMPKLPTQFSDVTKYLPSLPPELRQEFSRIRLTQIPRNIAQTVSELLPKGAEGAEGAEGSADPALSSLAQSFSDIPQKLSQFPARTQQYFHNVRNRLNSLMPQDA